MVKDFIDDKTIRSLARRQNASFIEDFGDKTEVFVAWGSFDGWCVYYHNNQDPEKEVCGPVLDANYFKSLKNLGIIYGNKKVYNDFLAVYHLTQMDIDKQDIEKIKLIASKYNATDWLQLVAYKLFLIFYLTMLAEQNKEWTKLGKNIKRLAAHKILVENADVNETVEEFRGVDHHILQDMCAERWKLS